MNPAAAPARSASHSRSLLGRVLRGRTTTGYLFLAPSLVLTIVIMLYPLGFSLVASFQHYELARPDERTFIGLANYIWAVQVPTFPHSILLTVIFTVAAVTLEFLLGLGFALLLNREFTGQGIVRVILMLPLFLTPSVVGLMFLRLYYPGDGLIIQLLSLIGVDRNYPLLGSPSTALPAVIFVDVWRTTPFMFVVLLAGMQAISPEVVEAAQIDGATGWQILRHVTLPLLTPLILIALTIRGMDAFREFDTFLLLTGGGPGEATEVISILDYLLAFHSYDIGRASAVAWIIVLLVLVFSIFFVKRLRDLQVEA
ncbi:MAG: sugar ABC transporter permease [Chloroflexi bacterium]|nr:sugar ABC transporter permease [Chloroflexota bacterium]